MPDMKLGLALGYWGSHPPTNHIQLAQEAERLGYDSVWTAEAYGSDALSPLAWIGANTSTIRLGTGVIQLSARTPTATAMAAMTMDHLSNGRMIIGLGVSGPQVVEGWYGGPFAKPLARTREYIDIMRKECNAGVRVQLVNVRVNVGNPRMPAGSGKGAADAFSRNALQPGRCQHVAVVVFDFVLCATDLLGFHFFGIAADSRVVVESSLRKLMCLFAE